MTTKEFLEKVKRLTYLNYELTFSGDCSNADDFEIILLYDKKIAIIDFGV
jgi:hypothetical protein